MRDTLGPLLTTAIPWAWLSILAPLAAATWLAMAGGQAKARAAAALSLAVSLFCGLVMLLQLRGSPARIVEPLLSIEAINAVPLLLFPLIALVTVLAAPRRDASPRALASLLLLAASTILVYAADHLALFLAGWALTIVPFLDRRRLWPAGVLVAGTGVLAVALGALVTGSAGLPGSWSLTTLRAGHPHGSTWEFWLLMLAILLRKGIFPLQSWVTATFDRSSLGLASLLFNGHLGAFLLLRIAVPLAPDAARQWFPLLTAAALFTAVYAAVMALTEKLPRRLLALVSVSQACCILAGLESATPEGIEGALMQWLVVGLAHTGLASIIRLIEVRHGEPITGLEFLGLAERLPRLAAFFAISALAMVGLPGTLGFCAEDLLMHGVLETQPLIGILQPLAAAFNAMTLLRLFSTLFLGRRVKGMEGVPDAIPRERFALAALIVLLVAGGLAPRLVVALHGSESGAAAALLTGHPSVAAIAPVRR